MQNHFFSRTLYTIGVALTAIILTASNLHAGLFSIPSEPADWNGPYVGFNVGGVWGNLGTSGYTSRVDLTKQFNEIPPVTSYTDINDAFFMASGHSSTDANGIGGIDLGYNKQWGMFVAGFGFGFSGTLLQDSSSHREVQTNDVTLTGPTTTFVGTADTDFHSMREEEQIWSGYAGGQIGLAWHRFLFYANGGSAFAQIDARTLDRATSTFFFPNGNGGTLTYGPQTDKQLTATNNIEAGWYAGGGLQFAFSDTLTAGLQYRHSDYNDRLYKFNNHQAVFPGATRFSEDTNSVVFTVTVMLGHLGEKKAPAPGLSKK